MEKFQSVDLSSPSTYYNYISDTRVTILQKSTASIGFSININRLNRIRNFHIKYDIDFLGSVNLNLYHLIKDDQGEEKEKSFQFVQTLLSFDDSSIEKKDSVDLIIDEFRERDLYIAMVLNSQNSADTSGNFLEVNSLEFLVTEPHVDFIAEDVTDRSATLETNNITSEYATAQYLKTSDYDNTHSDINYNLSQLEQASVTSEFLSSNYLNSSIIADIIATDVALGARTLVLEMTTFTSSYLNANYIFNSSIVASDNALSTRISDMDATSINSSYLSTNYIPATAIITSDNALSARTSTLETNTFTSSYLGTNYVQSDSADELMSSRTSDLEGNIFTSSYLSTNYVNGTATDIHLSNRTSDLEKNTFTTTYLTTNYLSSSNQDEIISVRVSDLNQTVVTSSILSLYSLNSSSVSTTDAHLSTRITNLSNVTVTSEYLMQNYLNSSAVYLSDEAMSTRISDLDTNLVTSSTVISNYSLSTDIDGHYAKIDDLVSNLSDIVSQGFTSDHLFTYLFTSGTISSTDTHMSTRVSDIQDGYMTSSAIQAIYAQLSNTSDLINSSSLASIYVTISNSNATDQVIDGYVSNVSNRTSDLQRDYTTSNTLGSDYVLSSEVLAYVDIADSIASDLVIAGYISDVSTRVSDIDSTYVTSSVVNSLRVQSDDMSGSYPTITASTASDLALAGNISDISTRTSDIQNSYITTDNLLTPYVTISESNTSDSALVSDLYTVNSRVSDIYVNYVTSSAISLFYASTDLTSTLNAIDTRISDIEDNYVTSSGISNIYLLAVSDVLSSDIEAVSSRTSDIEQSYRTSSVISSTYVTITDSAATDTVINNIISSVSTRTSDIQKDYSTSGAISAQYINSSTFISTYVTASASNSSDANLISTMNVISSRTSDMQAETVTSSNLASNYAGGATISDAASLVSDTLALLSTSSDNSASISTLNSTSQFTSTLVSDIGQKVASDEVATTSDITGVSDSLALREGELPPGKFGGSRRRLDYVGKWDMDLLESDTYGSLANPDPLVNTLVTNGSDGEGLFLSASADLRFFANNKGFVSLTNYGSYPVIRQSDTVTFTVRTASSGTFNGNTYVAPVSGHTPVIQYSEDIDEFSLSSLGTISDGILADNSDVEFSFVYTGTTASSIVFVVTQSSSAGSAVIRNVRIQNTVSSDISTTRKLTGGIVKMSDGLGVVSDENSFASAIIQLDYHGVPTDPGTLYVYGVHDGFFTIRSTNETDSNLVAWTSQNCQAQLSGIITYELS